MEPQEQRPNSVALWIQIFVVVLLAVSVIYTFFNPPVSPIARQCIYFVIAIFVALLLANGSNALLAGNLGALKFHAGGPLAGALITYLLLFYFIPTGETRNVRFYLRYNNQLLEKDFSIRAIIAKMEPQAKEGHNGEASIELSSHITKIDDITVKCIGYKLEGSGPYEILNGSVVLEMMKTGSIPPPGPGELPPLSVFSDIPSRESVHKQPLTKPDAVSLHYRNLTDADITLHLYSWSRHYKILDENIDGGNAWMSMPIEPKEEFTVYNNFDSGTGWFGLVVEKPKGAFQFLGIENLFHSKNSYLTIKKALNAFAYTISEVQ